MSYASGWYSARKLEKDGSLYLWHRDIEHTTPLATDGEGLLGLHTFWHNSLLDLSRFSYGLAGGAVCWPCSLWLTRR